MESTTRDQSTEIVSRRIDEVSLRHNIKIYLLNPLSSGLVGFAVLFSIIILTRFFGYFLGTYESFYINISDVINSMIGFLFVAGEKFLKFFIIEE